MIAVPRVSVVGLGRVGAVIAAAFATRGLEVVGVDLDPTRIAMLNGELESDAEPGLEQALVAVRDRLRATSDHRAAVLATDVTYVLVPTPSDERGAYNLEYVRAAFVQIGRGLAEKETDHVVILASTVLPGATRFGLQPALEAAAGRAVGDRLGLCYSPPFIALGSVLSDFLAPDFALVGEHDRRSGDVLEAVYRAILGDEVPVKRMSIENAELAKVALNTFLTTKIAFANMLADLCERLPGGDVDMVTDAIGTDQRIGSRLMTAGLGYGGPCLPRDNAALGFLASALGAGPGLSATTDALNRALPAHLLERLGIAVKPGERVAVLGLGYKAGSAVTEASQGVLVASALADAGADVHAYDPNVEPETASRLFDGARVTVSPTLDACLDRAHGVVLTTPDRGFVAARDSPGPRWIVDAWRVLGAAPDGARLIEVGRSADDEHNAASLRALWRAR